jgi:hypothetical protein
MAHNLIASDRVEGTPVCRPTGEQIGVIQRLMIDKLSGQIAYAVLSFGGFLGFGQKHVPMSLASGHGQARSASGAHFVSTVNMRPIVGEL